MVCLASIEHNGKAKLVAEIPTGIGFCDLSSIADNARDFFLAADGVGRAKKLIAEVQESEGTSHSYIPGDATFRRLAPIDGSLVGKFLCIGMNYTVCGWIKRSMKGNRSNNESIDILTQSFFEYAHRIIARNKACQFQKNHWCFPNSATVLLVQTCPFRRTNIRKSWITKSSWGL